MKKKNKKREEHNHPEHYQVEPFWCTEVADIIDAFSLGFYAGNAIKYILRAGKKHDRDSDLRKAIWYTQRMLGMNKHYPNLKNAQPK